MDPHVNYTILAGASRAIPSLSVTPIRVIAAVRRLVAVEPMCDFWKRCCCILMRRLIEVPLKSLSTTRRMKFINLPVLLEEHVTVTVLVDTPAFAVHLRNPSIIAEEGACDAATVATADQANLIHEEGAQNEYEYLWEQNCREEIKIPGKFNTHCANSKK